MQTKLHVSGMHCSSCKKLIESVCSEIEGVESCSVNYETGEMVIDHTDSANLEKLKEEIRSLGEYNMVSL